MIVLLSQPGTAQLFEDVTSRVGLDHQQHRPANPALNFLQAGMSGAAAAVDYDNDGWADLYFTCLDGPNHLYRNLGDGSFANVTDAVLGRDHLKDSFSNGCAWADIDNDGDQDLYVTSLATRRYHLFVNDGAGSFSEEAVERGAALEGLDRHYGMSASFGDFDNDGYLDLHVNEWRTDAQNPLRRTPNTRLLRNRGAAAPGHFEDVTSEAGVTMDQGWGGAGGNDSLAFSSRFIDIDRDGWPELVVVSDAGTSRLFWNRGDGSFLDGTSGSRVGTDQFGMGMAIGDYDGDGDFDWFVTSIHGTLGGNGNRLYRYEGERSFQDVTDQAGVRNGGWGWGASFLDFDNDRHLDLVMVNGVPTTTPEPAILWRNSTGGQFARQAGSASGFTGAFHATGLVCLDYDRDGDLDVLVVRNGGQPVLYRNRDTGGHRWLSLRAVGTRSNRDAVGAIVTIRTDAASAPLVRYVDGGSNFLGQNERAMHFGLGPDQDLVPEVEIQWPSGIVQTLRNLPVDQHLEIREPVLEPAKLVAVRHLPHGGGFETTWDSSRGITCLIETSEDLETWRKAAVIELQEGRDAWIDSRHNHTAPPGRRFYRGWK